MIVSVLGQALGTHRMIGYGWYASCNGISFLSMFYNVYNVQCSHSHNHPFIFTHMWAFINQWFHDREYCCATESMALQFLQIFLQAKRFSFMRIKLAQNTMKMLNVDNVNASRHFSYIFFDVIFPVICFTICNSRTDKQPQMNWIQRCNKNISIAKNNRWITECTRKKDIWNKSSLYLSMSL